MTLADAAAVRSESPGRYRADVRPGWDIAGAANGGYLMAIVANAVLEATGAADPVTVTAHYLAPARPGPVTVDVTTVRSGRRLSTATAQMRDARAEPLVVALATVGSLRSADDPRTQPVLLDAEPPNLPPPGECVLIEPTDTFPPPFMAQVRLRLPPDVTLFGGSNASRRRAEIRGWFALDDDEPLDTRAVLLAADAFPPPVFASNLPVAWTPTVELTVQVRARPSASMLQCLFRTRHVADGLLEADGEIWDVDGRLVALSRQLALVPRG